MSNEDTLGYASNSAVARILLRHDLQTCGFVRLPIISLGASHTQLAEIT